MDSFLRILQSITGKNKDNKNTFNVTTDKIDKTSPTGHRTTSTDDTYALIDSFRFPNKEELENRGREYMEGQGFWGIHNYSGGGSSTAKKNVGYGETGDVVGFNQPEYVPFVYTNTNDPNEKLKYGYIVRFAGSGDMNTVDGVILENRDLTAEGTKKFFQSIKDNGGHMSLYGDAKKVNGRGVRLPDIEKSIDVEPGGKWTYTYGKGPHMNNAFSGSYDLIRALREANQRNRNNGQ